MRCRRDVGCEDEHVRSGSSQPDHDRRPSGAGIRSYLDRLRSALRLRWQSPLPRLPRTGRSRRCGDDIATRSRSFVTCRAGARTVAANVAELLPRFAPLAPTRNTRGRPCAVRRSATAPASQYTRPAASAARLAGTDSSDA